jgi:hypothetical protein
VKVLCTGVGFPPGVTDLPPAEEPLKGLFEGILATGATLEQQLQQGQEERLADEDVLLGTLYRRWRSAVPHFVAHLRSSPCTPARRA